MFSPIIVTSYLFTLATAPDKGQMCYVPGSGESGKCINIRHCEYAKTLLRNGKNVELCGFSQKDLLVCCPTSQNPSAVAGTRSRKMCEIYHRKPWTTVEDRFADMGTPAKPTELPHMAALGYDDNNKTSYLCGGTLISHFYILTAAHCVTNREYGPPKWVRLGDPDFEGDATRITVSTARIHIHPRYKKNQNDIALIKSSEKIHFNPFVLPACLQTETNIPVKVLGAAGWGKQGLFGEPSTRLLKVTLRLADHRTCKRRYSEVVNRFQVCAGDSVGQDTCPGDSGGPLHYHVNDSGRVQSHFVVAGVTSFGRGCGGENSLGVYTRVSAYLEWIESIVWSGEE